MQDCTTVYHPVDRASPLLSLGLNAHVRKDNPHTVALEEDSRKFTQRLLDEFFKSEKVTFTIRPVGSFECDTKVGDIDEFEYLCVLDETPGGWRLKMDEKHKWRGVVEEPDSRLQGCSATNLSKHIESLRDESNLSHRDPVLPKITNISSHGPATSVDLTWCCSDGHQHSVTIKISMAVKVHEETIRTEISNRIETLGAPFQGVLSSNIELIFVNKGREWIMTTCVYDFALFDSLEEHLTPNIRPLFRCLKILIQHILPKQVWKDEDREYRDCHTHVKELVSPYFIKCLVMKEAKRCPQRCDWEGERLCDRLVSILTFSQPYEDIITGERFSIEVGKLLSEHDNPIAGLKALTAYIRQNTFPGIPTMDQTASKTVVYIQGKNQQMHIVEYKNKPLRNVLDLESFALPGGIRTYVYILPAASPASYHSHPLIQWCRRYTRELYEKNGGLDLTGICTEDLHLVWGLVYGGTLTRSHIARFSVILQKLRDLFDKYGKGASLCDSKLWTMYITGSPINSSERQSHFYFSTANVKVLETILRHTVAEQTAKKSVLQPAANWDRRTSDMDDDKYGESDMLLSSPDSSLILELGEKGQGFKNWWTEHKWSKHRRSMCVYQSVHNLLMKSLFTHQKGAI